MGCAPAQFFIGVKAECPQHTLTAAPVVVARLFSIPVDSLEMMPDHQTTGDA